MKNDGLERKTARAIHLLKSGYKQQSIIPVCTETRRTITLPGVAVMLALVAFSTASGFAGGYVAGSGSRAVLQPIVSHLNAVVAEQASRAPKLINK